MSRFTKDYTPDQLRARATRAVSAHFKDKGYQVIHIGRGDLVGATLAIIKGDSMVGVDVRTNGRRSLSRGETKLSLEMVRNHQIADAIAVRRIGAGLIGMVTTPQALRPEVEIIGQIQWGDQDSESESPREQKTQSPSQNTYHDFIANPDEDDFDLERGTDRWDRWICDKCFMIRSFDKSCNCYEDD